jgi:hypothetical protein
MVRKPRIVEVAFLSLMIQVLMKPAEADELETRLQVLLQMSGTVALDITVESAQSGQEHLEYVIELSAVMLEIL